MGKRGGEMGKRGGGDGEEGRGRWKEGMGKRGGGGISLPTLGFSPFR